MTTLQKDSERPLKIATIFSFAANEEQSAIGEILDETFEPSAMDSSAGMAILFLTKIIKCKNQVLVI